MPPHGKLDHLRDLGAVRGQGHPHGGGHPIRIEIVLRHRHEEDAVAPVAADADVMSGHADGREELRLVDGDHGQVELGVVPVSLVGSVARDLDHTARHGAENVIDDALHREGQRHDHAESHERREEERDSESEAPGPPLDLVAAALL